MAQRRIGVKQIMVDGEVVDVLDGVDYSLGGDKLEEVMGLDRMHGAKVTRIPGFIEFTITDRNGLDVKALTSKRDSTITVDLEIGKTLKFGHAFQAGEGKVTGSEGKVELRFVCDAANAEEV